MLNPHRVRVRATLNLIIGQLLLAAIVILLIDFACYIFLPQSVSVYFPGYGRNIRVWSPAIFQYSPGYFVRHPNRGFDIGNNRQGTQLVEGQTYPIWSNSFGCFDREWETPPANYIYFAGDSFTWGYAPFETKFATVFERLTGIKSLKCGVTHTGQLHQLAKFEEITAKLGVYPNKVVIGYYSNDTVDDYAFPSSTIIDGQIIDNAYLDDQLRIVRANDAFISAELKTRLAESRRRELTGFSISHFLTKHSITLQIWRKAWGTVRIRRSDLVVNGVPATNLYRLEEMQTQRGYLEYGAFHFAENNKEVLKRWKNNSTAHGYELTVLLIPPKRYFNVPYFYKELKEFLSANKIGFIDLSEDFRGRNLAADEIYWPSDAHLSPAGNRLVGEILSRRLVD